MELVDEMKEHIEYLKCILAQSDKHEDLYDRGWQAGKYFVAGTVLPCLKKAVAMLEGEGGSTERAKILENIAVRSTKMIEDIAVSMHYPECWDTSVYPTLAIAMMETECNPDCCTHDKKDLK